ncbi:hypothetical protein Taro_009357 [Colocasia esculenta]|uniref:Uncharacterized protein n=1 Tax=Colocasia esculenta TaxID=4460 RepID=A0A843U5H2_COLES|nr:hypothetical protein [Colocasia esculenta]
MAPTGGEIGGGAALLCPCESDEEHHTYEDGDEQAVDTRSSQVDTSPRFQKVRSTLDQVRSTLVTDSRRQESPYTSRRSLLAAKGGFPDLSPSPEAASHPFKRKDVGIKGNPWREAVVLNLESSYSGCCLSRRAQFRVVVLQVFLESSCSRVFGVAVLLCELYSRKVRQTLASPRGRIEGFPACCFFSKEESEASLFPLRFSIVAKTPYGRPAFSEIRSHGIWIGVSDDGFWQNIMYPRLQAFCTGCYKVGHVLADSNLKARSAKFQHWWLLYVSNPFEILEKLDQPRDANGDAAGVAVDVGRTADTTGVAMAALDGKHGSGDAVTNFAVARELQKPGDCELSAPRAAGISQTPDNDLAKARGGFHGW